MFKLKSRDPSKPNIMKMYGYDDPNDWLSAPNDAQKWGNQYLNTKCFANNGHGWYEVMVIYS